MWHFVSPDIVFGEDSLSYLEQITGRLAYVITDEQIVKLGFLNLLVEHLNKTGIEHRSFTSVEPEPSLETIYRGALAIRQHNPDWIIGLGGGSAIDAAKAMWVLYERPDILPDSINPFEPIGLRKKARLITIPTTSGTGSDTNWAMVLTDRSVQRKLGLGSRELHADIAIIDPIFCSSMPPQLTADTGIDALTHAVEAYTCTWSNDFTDGLSLQAIKLIFRYLPRAFFNGNDGEAREKMHNAASIAGLAFGNSMTAIAHSMAHSLGALFHIPHGRAVGLFLPYTIEFAGDVASSRYADILSALDISYNTDEKPSVILSRAIRELTTRIKLPMAIKDLRINRDEYEHELPTLVSHANMDTQTITAPRIPSEELFTRIFQYAYDGKAIDF